MPLNNIIYIVISTIITFLVFIGYNWNELTFIKIILIFLFSILSGWLCFPVILLIFGTFIIGYSIDYLWNINIK